MGIDPIHFGILTPPLGFSLFISAGMNNFPLERVVDATIPFRLSMLVFLLFITFAPTISTILPEMMDNTKQSGRHPLFVLSFNHRRIHVQQDTLVRPQRCRCFLVRGQSGLRPNQVQPQYRTDWEAGKCKADEQKYIENFKKISVPLDDVMKNFK